LDLEQTLRQRIRLDPTRPLMVEVSARSPKTRAGSSLSRFKGIFKVILFRLIGSSDNRSWCMEPYRTRIEGTLGSVHPFFRSMLDDAPTAPGAIFQGNGMVDWLDSPGLLAFGPYGDLTISASLTFSFRSSLFNPYTGDSCSVNWTLRVEVHDGWWNVWLQ
jgi:hypothetical protein